MSDPSSKIKLAHVYKALTALLDAAGISQATVIDIALTEFAKHKSTGLSFANDIDSLVDAAYYVLDTMVRGRSTWLAPSADGPGLVLEPREQAMYSMVAEFTHGAFGQDVTSEQERALPFVIGMVLSEILEMNFESIDPDPSTPDLCRLWLAEKFTGRLHIVRTVPVALECLLRGIVDTCVDLPGLFEAAFIEVHSANMRKGQQINGVWVFQTSEIEVAPGRTMKKIIKPKGYVAANVEAVVAAWEEGENRH